MKSQRIDKSIWIRWGFFLASLLFVVVILNEMIHEALLSNDRRTMDARASLIESMTVRDGSLRTNGIAAALSQYAAKEHIQISFYDRRHHFIFSTKRGEKNTLGRDMGFTRSGDSLVYISELKSKGRTVGYLKMTGTATHIVGLNLIYMLIIVGGVALLLYRDLLIRSYVRPIRFAARMIEHLLEGSYNMVASEHVKHESVLRLNLAMNRLSHSIHELKRSYSRQQDSMTTLIENIGNGLLFIDGVGRLLYINQAYKEDFRTSASDWNLADYHEVVPYPEVRELIDEAFRTKEKIVRQLQLPVHIERKHFDVSCAPILNKRKKVRGIVVVFHDISTIKNLENMRKDFVANVSHELKTPITSLIGFTETLLDGATEDKDMEKQFLQIILHEGQRMQSLVSDLLELSKIERAHFSLQWAKVSLSNVLDSVLVILKEEAAAKKIELVRLPGDEGLIAGDAFRIRQIMINLISNALAYTPENGRVAASIHERDQEADFVVADTGIGMEKEQIPRIFERFYRIDKARSRDSGGTGLGLAIVKHLVEAHEGSIHVESEPGKGSIFTITFKKNHHELDK